MLTAPETAAQSHCEIMRSIHDGNKGMQLKEACEHLHLSHRKVINRLKFKGFCKPIATPALMANPHHH